MDRIKVDNFLGLYTNVDEAKLNPEYQSEAVNVRFRTGYIESEGYVPLEANLPANVIYEAPVRLDEDKFKNKVENEELVSDYVQNLTDHLLSVVKEDAAVDILKVFIDDIEVFYYNHIPIVAGSVIKVWNKNGIVILLTDTETYWIGKIDRLTTYPTLRSPGYYLYKFVDLDYQPIPLKIETGVFDDYVPVTIKIVRILDLEIGFPNNPIKQYTIEARHSNDRLLAEFSLRAIQYTNGGPFIIDEDAQWALFRDTIKPSVGDWDPAREYSIGELMQMTGLRSKISFAEENMFTEPKNEFVITYIFDNRDEYAMSYFIREVIVNSNYVIKMSQFNIGGITTSDKNYRITGVALYMRQNDKDDFEQIMFWDINKGKQDPGLFNVLYIDKLNSNGIFLSQSIGTIYKPKEYKPIDKFVDYLEIDGIAYAVSDQRVYFPAIGSGMIMNGVFLDYIPEVEGDLLSDINGTLGVFGTQLKLVVAQDSRDGYLLFSIKDKMNFKIRDQYDLATSPEGIIIHTKRGIYVTNGYERKLISEQINNIVERNFDTGNIFYHRTEDILFYSYVDSKGNYHTFKFDFVYGNWSEVKDGISGKLTFSEDGIIHFLNEERGKVYKLDKTNNVYSVIRTPNVDLDYPLLGKNLIYIDVDFEGELNYENYKVTHTKRMTARLGVPVSKRIPNALIGAKFIFKGKIYSIDIYYDTIGEFRHENHIPSPETISEGIQQYPDYLESITK